ncbi:MAG: hypothetical protein HUU55_05735 [Myxococcales bacterium]|nr:hypothetical protein [Myxococcales bacterium]
MPGPFRTISSLWVTGVGIISFLFGAGIILIVHIKQDSIIERLGKIRDVTTDATTTMERSEVVLTSIAEILNEARNSVLQVNEVTGQIGTVLGGTRETGDFLLQGLESTNDDILRISKKLRLLGSGEGLADANERLTRGIAEGREILTEIDKLKDQIVSLTPMFQKVAQNVLTVIGEIKPTLVGLAHLKRRTMAINRMIVPESWMPWILLGTSLVGGLAILTGIGLISTGITLSRILSDTRSRQTGV